jgi:hypothetical protein
MNVRFQDFFDLFVEDRSLSRSLLKFSGGSVEIPRDVLC